MHISYRWLGRHVDLSGITPQRVAEDLTLSTAEVEGLERFLPHLSDVVVGHVVKREKHPDAEKLSHCQVDVGGPEILGIVCGAPNVAAGQRVAVARPGTTLPGDVKIKKSKIRGVESAGMICSERELGLGDEHDGIWVLPADATVGRPVAEALGLEDWIIEIDNKSLTHRPDLWGHRGIAGEIAAMHMRPLKPLSFEMPRARGGAPFPVRIESENCSRYIAVPIDGVKSGRSPDWMRAFLFAVGQRPLDLLVDLSNFVMLDLGQPNHVFDRTRLSPEGIVVRNARDRETLRTLDGVDRALTTQDLLICSGDEPVALAGVMGGEGSKVAPGTRSILLEAATFLPASVRRTAQRLALRTDSSARFEKSLDPTLAMKAAAHFVNLLREIEPAIDLPAPLTDVGTWTDPARTIPLRTDRARSRLGADISDTEIADILTRLSFGVQSSGGELFVRIPSARATKDVSIEEDLIEEIGRIHRYGNIPERRLTAEIVPPQLAEGGSANANGAATSFERRMLVRRIQDRLAGAARFHEAMSYSFIADSVLEVLGSTAEPHVAVINPAAEGFSRVRRGVLPSLLASLRENRRQREEVKLFEVGKGYRPEQSDSRGQPSEVHELALVWASPPPPKDARFDAARFSHLEGVLDDMVVAAGRAPLIWRRIADGAAPVWAHPGRAIEGRIEGSDAVVATLAEIEPALRRRLGLDGELASDVACAVVSIDALLASARKKPGFAPTPKFPGVKVDVAVAIPDAVQCAAIVAAIEKAGKGLVQSSELFDVYAGANLGGGRKSLAFHVLLQSDSRTLGEADVQKFLERVEREVRELGGELRRE